MAARVCADSLPLSRRFTDVPIQTVLTQRLRLQHPIIQAPLAGGSDTPHLVAAVCNAGGIGFIGAAYSTPEQILERAAAVRAQTQRPFGINLFAPMPVAEMPSSFSPALQRVAPYFAELGLPAPIAPPAPSNRFSRATCHMPRIRRRRVQLYVWLFVCRKRSPQSISAACF